MLALIWCAFVSVVAGLALFRFISGIVVELSAVTSFADERIDVLSSVLLTILILLLLLQLFSVVLAFVSVEDDCELGLGTATLTSFLILLVLAISYFATDLSFGMMLAAPSTGLLVKFEPVIFILSGRLLG